MTITWHRITKFSEQAAKEGRSLPYVVRQYGQNPTMWECMELVAGNKPWRTVATGLRTESAAKARAAMAIERAGL
jgi:hypothetical protein